MIRTSVILSSDKDIKTLQQMGFTISPKASYEGINLFNLIWENVK